MELLKFEDTCIIKRYGANPQPEPEIFEEPATSSSIEDDGWEEENEGDEDWDEEEPTIIYEGPCMYQEGGTGFNFPVIQHSAVVFLPNNDTIIEVNDEITITTRKERERKAYAQFVKDVKLPLHEKEYTRIELKQNI